ncbi:MAG: hypothetical protein E7129_06060 [Rikenellaceae bacterium]|nr:hypothetical protein [Rikenellaceae bacterium]
MEQTEYFDTFENNLLSELLKLCTSHKMLEGTLLSSEDIDERWKEYAPEYMADAVPQVNAFPAAAIAWAGYVGMAVAHRWDEDWATYATEPYSALHGAEGFDDMDEHILQNILGLSLEEEQSQKIEDMMRRCANTAITYIRREEVEAQSTKAFYIFARTTRVLFRIGAAMELHRLGYKFEKVNLGTPSILN